MKTTCSLLLAICMSVGPLRAALITWTSSPAVNALEVADEGTQVYGYAFSSTPGDNVAVNGVTFLRTNTTGPIAAANALTPGFERFGTDSFGEADDNFYLGPDPQLNQLLDGLTWGGTSEFQLTGLTDGQTYLVQIFSSDDRATQVNRVLDIDSSLLTPNGSRQLENIDYTAGGAWVDPANRLKIFTGTFTADGFSQEIRAALIEPPGTADGAGQIDLNAIQLRIIPEPSIAALLLGVFGVAGVLRRRP